MSYKELQFYLLEQIKSKELHFKVESFLVLEKAVLQLWKNEKKTMDIYAELILEEINTSEHRDMLTDLRNMVIPFLPVKTLVLAH